jgi:hypothetical protein
VAMQSQSPGTCLLCLETVVLTEEHVIPQALGGKYAATIYCKRCNIDLGNTADSELAKTYGYLATVLKIRRDRGGNPAYEVKDVQRDIKLTHDGRTLSRKHPVVKFNYRDGKVEGVDITARSKKELEAIRERIKAKHGISEPGRTFMEQHPGPIDATYDRRIDTRPIRRAIAKIAYGFLCTKIQIKHILSPSFSSTRDFVRNDRGDDLASANFVDTKWMSDYVRPLHRIHISLNRRRKMVVGYVMLFGIYKFTVLLSRDFESCLEWSDLDYTFDPLTRKVIEGTGNFLSPPITELQILRPKQSKQFVCDELTRCHKIVFASSDGVAFLGMEMN